MTGLNPYHSPVLSEEHQRLYSPKLSKWFIDAKRYELSKLNPSISITLKDNNKTTIVTGLLTSTLQEFKKANCPSVKKFTLDGYREIYDDESNNKKLFQLGFYNEVVMECLPETNTQAQIQINPTQIPVQTQMNSSQINATQIPLQFPAQFLIPPITQPTNPNKRQKLEESTADATNSASSLNISNVKTINSTKSITNALDREDVKSTKDKEEQTSNNDLPKYQFIFRGTTVITFTLEETETFQNALNRYKELYPLPEGASYKYTFGDKTVQKKHTPKSLKASSKDVNIVVVKCVNQPKIRITVKDMDKVIPTSYFKIKAGAKLKKFFELYSVSNGLKDENLKFYVHGQRVSKDMSTSEAGLLEDNCVVWVRANSDA